MGNVYELTSLGPTTFTGSVYANANSAGTTYVASISSSSLLSTGSWYGLANTWGGFDMSTTLTGSTTTGSWGGVAYSQGVSTIASESYDRFSTIANGTPSVNQGVGPGAWNPFPAPEAPPAGSQATRDVTRYRKTYSSQRMQPRPVRIVRG